MNNHEILASKIEAILKDKFPNAYVSASYSDRFCESIGVRFGLIGDDADLPWKIRQNDPLHTIFNIFVSGDDSYEAKILTGGLSVNPPEGSYLAMEHVKVPFRKTKGDEKRVIKAFERFADRAANVVRENKENIYQVDRVPAKYLEV